MNILWLVSAYNLKLYNDGTYTWIMCVSIIDAYLSFICRRVALAEGRVQGSCNAHPRP